MLKQLTERFTAIPLVGVDVGSAAIKVVKVSRLGRQVILDRCAVTALEDDKPIAVLKLACAKAGIATAQVALGLAAPEVIVRPFQFPHMPKKELASALRLEAEQAILNGHSPSEMAVDWHTFADSKESVRGLLAVVPKALVARRLRLAKAAGLRASVVDVEGLALWNAYWALMGVHEAEPKTVLLVNVGMQTTNLVIAKGPNELMLVRDLELGGKALAHGQQKEWVGEIHDSLGYARSKGGLRGLDAAYLTGGGSSPDVMTLLMSAVAAPVEFWNPLTQVVRNPEAPPVDETVGPLLAVAIGLALRHQQ